ncbi:RDD family protein [Microtetraspora malaysiensis]|uniref:RDD family protein n=1 Tax=Microtetraspora malaysiensis TaxID=161358 RepID=UPI00082A1E7D|nr:RDD family protein [Microtetraspora malaysiensis]
MEPPFPPEGEPRPEPRTPWEPPPLGPAAPSLAGRWRRLFAGIFDIIVVAIISSPVVWTSWHIVKHPQTGTVTLVDVTHTYLASIVGFLYYWLFHAYWKGQTPGKKIFGMRVVRENGERIGVGQAAVRQLTEVVLAWLCCLWILDLGWIVFDGRKQALHDKTARTLVVDA